MAKKFDVIIVGAGLVGLTLACALVQADFTVAIVEANPLEPVDIVRDQIQCRVSAINPFCQTLFEKLTVWQKILASKRVSAFESMQVWDSQGRGEINFDCTQIAQPCLGYILEHAIILNALLATLFANPNLTIFSPAKPVGLALSTGEIELALPGRSLTAKLIVGADGANSWLRSQANIHCHSWSYHQEAMVTTVRTQNSHQKTAWQCFLPQGPLALLPLFEDHLCSIVWSGSPLEISRLKALKEPAFNREISQAFEFRLGNIEKIAAPITLPLYMQHAKEYVKPRLALIGDAAHTIHPLAGQGINLGFADAMALAYNLIQTREQKKDWGDYLELRKYERQRKSENWLMIAGMEFFKQLFQSKNQVAVCSRSFALNTIDKVAFLKNQFIDHAMGRSSSDLLVSVGNRP